MAELIEDCLHIIFGYLTPVEWIQISEVCQLWKTVVQKQWQKFNEISFFDQELGKIFCCSSKPPLVRLKSEEAEKLIRYAAEFCNVVNDFSFKRIFFIMLKDFKYIVHGCTLDRSLQLLAKNATEINELHLQDAPEIKSLQLLFERNKIKTLKINKCNQFWPHVPTDGIQIMDVCFKDPNDEFVSFEGHFVNLQTLTLGIHIVEGIYNVKGLLSQTLPYVRGIKSLKLYIETSNPPDYIEVLNEVVMCAELEEFSLEFSWPFIFSRYEINPKFDEEFETTCFSKLRVLALEDLSVSDRALKSMLVLPNLEKLDVAVSKNGFNSVDQLPEMSKLTEFTIGFQVSATVNLKNLSNAVKMMPQLQSLCVKGITKKQMLTLTCDVTIWAALQEKDVIVEHGSEYEDDFKKLLKIESTRNDQSHVQILCLRFINISKRRFFISITRFVRKQLKGYRVLKLNDY